MAVLTVYVHQHTQRNVGARFTSPQLGCVLMSLSQARHIPEHVVVMATNPLRHLPSKWVLWYGSCAAHYMRVVDQDHVHSLSLFLIGRLPGSAHVHHTIGIDMCTPS